jgi:hypothetical protein
MTPYKLVPVVPTEEMLKASPIVGTGPGPDGWWCTNTKPAQDVWAAMLEAAPYPPLPSLSEREELARLIADAINRHMDAVSSCTVWAGPGSASVIGAIDAILAAGYRKENGFIPIQPILTSNGQPGAEPSGE